MKKEIFKTDQGITIVALVITIIVLLILSVVTIQSVNGEGIIGHAKMAALKQEIAVLKEEYGLFCTEKIVETMGKFNQDTVVASVDALVYNEKEAKGKTIYDVMPSLKNSRYKDKTEIINGTIYVTTTNAQEAKVLEEYGMIANPFKIVDGVLKSDDDNLALLGEDGILVIPASVKKIDAGAFSNLKASNKTIKKVIIPGTVKEIGANAFSNNETLEEVVIEDGVEIIGTSAFATCANLKKVTMQDSVVEIGTQAFSSDYQLVQLRLSNNLSVIKSYLLSNCSNLTKIELPEKLESIEGRAFSGCIKLTKVKIPKNVRAISSSAFSACTNLSEIEIDLGNTNFASERGILFNGNKTEMIWVSQTAIDGSTFTVPDTVTTLGVGLINSYTNINKVVIPSATTSINFSFFTSNITEVTIASGNPNYLVYQGGIYNIDKTALYKYIANDAVVTLPEGLKSIGDYAFSEKRNTLTNITLPSTLISIGDQAFSGCTKLKEMELGVQINELQPLFIYNVNDIKITIDGSNPNYQIVENSILDIRNENEKKLLTVIGNPTSYAIPSGVTEIGRQAFHNKHQMTQIAIPNTVKKIGDSFNYCKSLTTINIPSSVESIGNACFVNCDNLQEIRIDKPENSILGAPWGVAIGERVKVIWKK